MYDYIIVTHLPSFYKVNLYRELAKKLKIFVLFISNNTNEKRSDDFVNLKDVNFKYEIVNEGNFQSRNKIESILKLRKVMSTIEYKRVLVSGWDLPEFWYLVILNLKRKNCLALESTIIESNTCGIKGLIKKIFLSRVSLVFASGELHIALLTNLKYQGIIKKTKGVGIINKPAFIKIDKAYQKKFLFIGRLSPVKNLKMLIEVFNTLPEHNLTIVGIGPLEKELQEIAQNNIFFINQIENSNLDGLFSKNDVLILPSINEPWGLVVEEALYFEKVVIVSKNCGSSDLINHNQNGFVIDPHNASNLKEIILNINEDKISKLKANIHSSFINEKDLDQVSAYI